VAVEFRVLGPTEALMDGSPLDVGHARRRSVLAVLLIDANRPVTLDQLGERIWGPAPAVKDPRAVLRTYLWHLRRTLAPADDVSLVRQTSGYKLAVDERQVDLYRFRDLLARAGTAKDDEVAGDLIEQASGLWRGEPFAGLDSPWIDAARQNLIVQRHAARLDLTDIQLRRGRHAALVAELTAYVEEHPLDERLAAQLMLALYRSGRAADALDRFRHLSRLLADDLGTDPGPDLRHLHRQILAADPALAPNPERTRKARQLPADTALFTGRTRELRRLMEAAEHARAGLAPGAVVITAIDGMGGVGKTALAIHAGHRLAEHFPDGQLFLDLYGFAEDRPPREPDEALAVLLAALGVPPEQLPAQVDARAALYRERLADTRTLVILDNAFDESQVRALLPAGAGCLVLVTSRRRLKALDDATPLTLGPLDRDEAVTLLRHGSRALAEPTPDARWEQVAELCGRLPLALLIAGALLRVGGRAWNLERLIDRFTRRPPGRELAGYADDTRNLTTVFDLSLRTLPEGERTLFHYLGLSPAVEIDAYAAAALLDADLDTAERRLERLADHSLLIGVSPGRYRIHDLVHAHARASGLTSVPQSEHDAAIGRLLSYWVHTAQTASALMTGMRTQAPKEPIPTASPELGDDEAARAWLRTERGNLDAAFDHVQGRNRHTIALAAGLAAILRIDGPWTRALEIHRIAVDAAEHAGHPADHAAALADLGWARQLVGDFSGATEVHTRALELHRELGDLLGEANALSNLGMAMRGTGNYPGAADLYARSLELHQALGNRTGEADALIELGRLRQAIGDYAGAAEGASRALRIHRSLGDRNGEAQALFALGRVRYATGDFAEAAEAHTQALRIRRDGGNRLGEANALTELGRVRHATEDFIEAEHALTQALELYRVLGNRLGEAQALTELGRVRHTRGEHDQAGTTLTQAIEIYREIGDLGDEAVAMNYHAAVLAATGRRGRALALYRQALALHRELRKADDEAFSLEGIAEHYFATDDPVTGTEYLCQALEIYRRLGAAPDTARLETRLRELS
jgi:DNA-binding SARP family transcriptional activator